MLNNVLTVSQLNRYVKALFDDNKLLSNIMIKGELSNFSANYASGHYYFSLKDAGAAVKAVMFKSYAQQLRFRPKDGQTVLLTCSVSVYERDGIYQLYVYDMQPDGAGAQALAFEQIKERLAAEGMFTRKRPLPAMPHRIGVITSETGAAVQDILSILGRRCPMAAVVLAPVAVQGTNAVPQMIDALDMLNRQKSCEVIILGRGGGSAEDLQAFNNEQLARAIFASAIPVISAVGHETDFTIADFVADLRAPTPSAAAELAVPDLSDLQNTMQALQNRMTDAMARRMHTAAVRLSVYQNHRALQSPAALLVRYRERIASSGLRVHAAVKKNMDMRKLRLSEQAALLTSLSPLGVLARGYAIAFRGGVPLTDSAAVSIGDELHIRLARGGLTVAVTGETEDNQNEKGIDAGTGHAQA